MVAFEPNKPKKKRIAKPKRMTGKIRSSKGKIKKNRPKSLSFKKTSLSKRIAVALLVLVVIVAGMAGYIMKGFGTTVDNGSEVYVKISNGMAASDIGRMLEDKKIISSSLRFKIIARLKGSASDFKTGVYELRYGLTEEEAIEMLSGSKATRLHIIIPEGLGVKDIAKRLDRMGVVNAKDFMQEAKDYAPYPYIKRNPEAHYAIEGFLFPATYDFDLEDSSKDILATMAKEMDKRLTPEIRQKAAERNLTIYQLITLASLVEKEAMYKEDRPIIAQVFFKRLAMDMPLQSDTTLQYLMDAPKEDVSIADTQIVSPYNTYEHIGLPPGPIASPGMDAIMAVLNPADTDYLYFVADRQGHNHYSYSYAEHMENVNQYR